GSLTLPPLRPRLLKNCYAAQREARRLSTRDSAQFAQGWPAASKLRMITATGQPVMLTRLRLVVLARQKAQGERTQVSARARAPNEVFTDLPGAWPSPRSSFSPPRD